MNKNYFYITVEREQRLFFFSVQSTFTADFDTAKQFQYREDAKQAIIDNRLKNAAVHELCSI